VIGLSATSSYSSSSGVDWLYPIMLVLFVLGVWALIDVISRSTHAFKAADESKPLWLVLLIVGLVFAGVLSGLLGVFYLVTVRPKVKAAARSMPSHR
jgi:hypothetical protein